MNKKIYLFILAILVFVTACENNTAQNVDDTIGDAMKHYYMDFYADDATSLSDAITKSYSFDELYAFFNGNGVNEGLDDGKQVLTLSEVHKKFPVEVIRTTGYTVYNVIGGGHYFVFWVNTYSDDSFAAEGEPIVWSSVYLPSELKSNAFEELKCGESTAADVVLIDPNFELSFLLSSGIYSYSLLDDNRIMQIKYVDKGAIEDYENLVIQEITIVERESTASRFSSILNRDLP